MQRITYATCVGATLGAMVLWGGPGCGGQTISIASNDGGTPTSSGSSGSNGGGNGSSGSGGRYQQQFREPFDESDQRRQQQQRRYRIELRNGDRRCPAVPCLWAGSARDMHHRRPLRYRPRLRLRERRPSHVRLRTFLPIQRGLPGTRDVRFQLRYRHVPGHWFMRRPTGSCVCWGLFKSVRVRRQRHQRLP